MELTMRRPPNIERGPCQCPGCEAFARALDDHVRAVHAGTATPADRARVERMAARCDKPHREVRR